MKKKQITFDRKLSLDRQIIGKLNESQMDFIAGGSVNTASCVPKPPQESDVAEAASCAACSCNHSGPHGC